MAHAQKPDFVFRRNGRVHLNRRGRQFSRLLTAEVCASAVRHTPCSEVVWRVLATHSILQFPLHFPSRASPCAITFQSDSTTCTIACHQYPRSYRKIIKCTHFVNDVTSLVKFETTVLRLLTVCTLNTEAAEMFPRNNKARWLVCKLFILTALSLRSGHTERGLPQRTAVSVRCEMLPSKQTLLTIIFWKHSS